VANPTREVEVCVVGGGPAGAVFALRMARLGHDVLVLERSAFPRSHIGEVLAPGIRPLLDFLDLRDAVYSAGSLPTTEARVRWAGQESVSVSIPAGQSSVTVDRGNFDLLLLRRASSAGAAVWQSALAGRAKRTAAGWELEASTPSGRRTVRAAFLADASGRGRVLGGPRTSRSVPTLALHATWRGTAKRPKATRLEAGPQGWFWGAHLPSGQFRAFAIVTAAVFRQEGVTRANLEKFYRSLLSATRVMDELIHPELDGRVAVCDASCYFDPDSIDETSIKLGDASFTIDPLSSSGVQKAIQSALTGAVAAHTMLLPYGDANAARAFYLDSQRFASDQHSQWAADYHADWRDHNPQSLVRQSVARPDHSLRPIGSAQLGDMLAHRARLARGAAFVDEPCIVGDRVVRKRALSHPRLGRPVAYLGDIELAPLVELLDQRATLGQAVWEWSHRLTPAKAVVVATWLRQHSLIEIACESADNLSPVCGANTAQPLR
jgi:2-polyprenyl-6-methoxyphenol hydroxylase-like FAD-dependent oxidoreductase